MSESGNGVLFNRENMGPFTLARAENSIRITAMIGTGLIATAIAYVRISAMLSDTVAPSRRQLIGSVGPYPSRALMA